MIIPGDESTSTWLLKEIFPQICFKTKRASGRLRKSVTLADDPSKKKTMMVRFTCHLPLGTTTNGKDQWWSLFCYWNGLSSGTKFHEAVYLKASGQTKLAWYVTGNRAAHLWHGDDYCQTGYRRPKTVVVNGGGTFVPVFCNNLSLRDTKEMRWQGIVNSLVPVDFDEEAPSGE